MPTPVFNLTYKLTVFIQKTDDLASYASEYHHSEEVKELTSPDDTKRVSSTSPSTTLIGFSHDIRSLVANIVNQASQHWHEQDALEQAEKHPVSQNIVPRKPTDPIDPVAAFTGMEVGGELPTKKGIPGNILDRDPIPDPAFEPGPAVHSNPPAGDVF
jgi:hypothetical protein